MTGNLLTNLSIFKEIKNLSTKWLICQLLNLETEKLKGLSIFCQEKYYFVKLLFYSVHHQIMYINFYSSKHVAFKSRLYQKNLKKKIVSWLFCLQTFEIRAKKGKNIAYTNKISISTGSNITISFFPLKLQFNIKILKLALLYNTRRQHL